MSSRPCPVTGSPVVAAYVKVFSCSPDAPGSSPAASFHKDGYTDRRGRFDYWQLTTGEAGLRYGRLAVLVHHAQLGSTVVQVTPPPH